MKIFNFIKEDIMLVVFLITVSALLGLVLYVLSDNKVEYYYEQRRIQKELDFEECLTERKAYECRALIYKGV